MRGNCTCRSLLWGHMPECEYLQEIDPEELTEQEIKEVFADESAPWITLHECALRAGGFPFTAECNDPIGIGISDDHWLSVDTANHRRVGVVTGIDHSMFTMHGNMWMWADAKVWRLVRKGK